jgi:hypothetical protein
MIYPEIRLTSKQSLAYDLLCDNVTNYLLYGASAGSGKTWLGCVWILLNCYNYPGSRWFVGRKELKRLMSSVVITFHKVFKAYKIPLTDWKMNGQYNYIEFTNGSRIDLLDLATTPTDPMFERLGSLEYTGGWLEEAGEIDFLAFDVLKSRVGRYRNAEYGLFPAKILLTCNPTKNWLYRTFYKPSLTNNLSPEYKFIKALYKDNPYTAEEYGKALNEISDPITRARLRDGIWEYEDADTVLIEYDSIIDMFTNTPEFTEEAYITADIARYGSDRTVYGLWKGYNLYKIIVKNHQGIDQTSTDLKTLMGENRIPYSHCVVDEDGVGGGVVDNLKGIKGFVNNSSPIIPKATNNSNTKRENYKNLKTQCSYLLADKINNHKIAVSAEMTEAEKDFLIEELGQIRRKITDDVSTLQLITKEEVKENLGRSPDLADCLMMRSFFDLMKPMHYIQPTEVGGVNDYYNKY